MNLTDKYPVIFSIILLIIVLTAGFYFGRLIIKIFKLKVSDKDLAVLLLVFLILYYIISGLIV